ncbi:MAG: hypothetical protein U1F45_05015 [Burkholderiales bacterium]
MGIELARAVDLGVAAPVGVERVRETPALRGRQGGARHVGEALREGARPVGQGRARHGPLDDAEPGGLGAVDHLAAEDEAGRGAAAAQAGEPLRAPGAGQEAEGRLGQAELRFRGGDAQVARERELEPAAERRAAELGERDEGRALDAVEQALHAPHEGDHRLGACGRRERGSHQREIGAGAECLLAAAQVQDAHRRVVGRLRDERFQRADQLAVQGVDRRPREGRGEECSAAFGGQHAREDRLPGRGRL